MPFPGAPRGFVCNARMTQNHEADPEGESCTCSACVRHGQPGLIEGKPVQTHPKFPVEHLVGLYKAEDVDPENHEPHLPLCCLKDPDTDEQCGEPVEWNVWHDVPGSNAEGVVIQVCAEHLDLVLNNEGRNVVWFEPRPQQPVVDQEEKPDDDERGNEV